MKVLQILAYVITSLLLCRGDALAEQPEPASLPYRLVCELAQLDSSKEEAFQGKAIQFHVASNDPKVSLQEIRLWIDSSTGQIPLQIDAQGKLSFPVSKELHTENPRILSNQPKGSMLLTGFMTIEESYISSKLREQQGKIRYADLFVSQQFRKQLEDQLNELVHKKDLEGALVAPERIKIQASRNSEEARVRIHAKSGVQQLLPEEPGMFFLKLDPELLKENPWVELGEGHDWMIRVEEMRPKPLQP